MQKKKDTIEKISGKISSNNIASGVVAGIFGCTGSAVLVVNAAEYLNLTKGNTVSWLFSIYFFGGLLGIIMSLKYKMPISGAYTLAGIALLLGANNIYSIEELSGSYLVTGIIILIFGILGLKEQLLKRLPEPIVMATVSGMLSKFVLSMIAPMESDVLLSVIVIVSFFVLPKFIKNIPPIVQALVVGLVTSMLLNRIDFTSTSLEYILPKMVIPKFNLQAIISISLPLSILIMGSENAQAIGILRSQGYDPPINNMTKASGLATIVTSLFGGHSANIAGPMTAICSSDEAGEDLNTRYMASVINGIIFICFGIFASIALEFVMIMPKALISLIAVLSMIGVLSKSLEKAFCDTKFGLASVISFIVALSEITLLKIGSPIWGLIIGFLIIQLTKRE